MILKLKLSGSRHSLATLKKSIESGEVEGVKCEFSMWESPFDQNKPSTAPSWMWPGHEDPDYLRRKKEKEEKEKKEKIDGTTPIDTVQQEV